MNDNALKLFCLSKNPCQSQQISNSANFFYLDIVHFFSLIFRVNLTLTKSHNRRKEGQITQFKLRPVQTIHTVLKPWHVFTDSRPVSLCLG